MITITEARNILAKENSKKYKDVKDLLIKASQAYYNSSDVIMSDGEYDDLYSLYKKLTGDTIVGAFPSSKKGQINVSHSYEHLVGTLDKARNLDEVEPFLKRLLSVPQKEYYIRLSLKFDGNSITIERDAEGNVIKALTRGADGKGKDLTKVFKNKKLGPLEFEDSPYAIKYEALISYENYDKVCEKYEASYANPRSLISGILGSDDALEYEEYITLVPLELRIASANGISYIDGKKDLFWSDLNEFYPNNWNNAYAKYITVKNKKEALEAITEYYNYVNSLRSSLPFMIDGIVVDFLNKDIIEKYFYDPRGRIPQHSFAVKLPYLESVAEVLDIVYTVGNSGRVTPNVVFTPVEFNGTIHKKQSIANYKRFQELKLGKGSKILVSYHNDCLSYITKIDSEENKKITPFEYIDHCPVCNADLWLIENDKGEETLTECSNPDCPSRILGKIENYFIKMDIKGIKMSTIEKLNEAGLISNIIDLYNIDTTKCEEVLGKKTTQNIIQAINEKEYYDYEILGSLNIEKTSTETTKVICKVFSLDELLNMSSKNMINKVSKLKGFSKLKTEYFVEGFFDNLETIKFLANRGYKKYKDMFKTTSAEGLTIVPTGIRFTPQEEMILINKGHRIVNGGVSKKTNIVVYGDEPGATKMNKASELGIKTMYIDEFREKYIN